MEQIEEAIQLVIDSYKNTNGRVRYSPELVKKYIEKALNKYKKSRSNNSRPHTLRTSDTFDTDPHLLPYGYIKVGLGPRYNRFVGLYQYLIGIGIKVSIKVRNRIPIGGTIDIGNFDYGLLNGRGYKFLFEPGKRPIVFMGKFNDGKILRKNWVRGTGYVFLDTGNGKVVNKNGKNINYRDPAGAGTSRNGRFIIVGGYHAGTSRNGAGAGAGTSRNSAGAGTSRNSAGDGARTHGYVRWFKNIKFTGKALALFNSNDKRHLYNGGFKNGKFHGNGRLNLRNRTYIEGKWKNGEINEGLMHYPNGSTYMGPFKNLVPHGKGTLLSNNFTKLAGGNMIKEGIWQNGKYIGTSRPRNNGAGTSRAGAGAGVEMSHNEMKQYVNPYNTAEALKKMRANMRNGSKKRKATLNTAAAGLIAMANQKEPIRSTSNTTVTNNGMGGMYNYNSRRGRYNGNSGNNNNNANSKKSKRYKTQ